MEWAKQSQAGDGLSQTSDVWSSITAKMSQSVDVERSTRAMVLISTENPDGTTNIAPMSSAWWIGKTAMLGLGADSQTFRNLSQRPAVVLNLVDGQAVDAVDRLALLTGRSDVPESKAARGYTYEHDKFAAAGLTPTEFENGGPLGVAECLIQLQGRVRTISSIDGEDSGIRAIEVAITAVTSRIYRRSPR